MERAQADPQRPVLRPGTVVGAQRWPYSGAHPDCWGKPWSGVILEVADPLAWVGTIAFPDGKWVCDGGVWSMVPSVPSRAEVLTHLLNLEARGLSVDDRVPVLWSFGAEQKVYWERRENLLPYAEDCRAWEQARRQRRIAQLGLHLAA